MGLFIYDYLNSLTTEELFVLMIVLVVLLIVVWIVATIYDFIKEKIQTNKRKYNEMEI